MAELFYFKDNVYKLKELNNTVCKFGYPIIVAEQKEMLRCKKDIDMKEFNSLNGRASELSTAINQLSEMIKKNPKDKESEKSLKDLTKKFNQLKNELETNESYKLVADTLQTLQSITYMQIASDENLMRPFLTNVLEGDVSKLDFNDIDIATLGVEVMVNFFIAMMNLKKK